MGYGWPEGNIFADAGAIGGGGGGEFTQCRTSEGLLVKKLGVWHNKKGLQAIRVTYTDGTDAPVNGTTHDDYDELTLAPEEVITRASLWGDGRGKASGHIVLATNKNQKLDVGKDVSGQTEYPIKIGSGILAGVCGRSGYNIDMLALIFLRPVESITLSDMTFGDLPVGSRAPKMKNLETVDFKPNSDNDTTWTFTNALQKTNTKQVQSTTTNTWGVKTTVTAKLDISVPFVVKDELAVSVEGSWSIAKAEMTSTTETEQITLTWGLTGKLAPKDEPIHCTASAVHGAGEFPYKAKSTITFADPPGKLTFTEKGTYKVDQWMKAFATAENSKGPVDATIIDPKDADGKPQSTTKALPATGASGSGGEVRSLPDAGPGEDADGQSLAAAPSPQQDGDEVGQVAGSAIKKPDSNEQSAQASQPAPGLGTR